MKNIREQKLPDSYPGHLTEGIRLEIGRMLIARETHKLVSSRSLTEIHDSIVRQFEPMDNDVHIRDFWNLAHALTMGYKLKDIVRSVTTPDTCWWHEEVEDFSGLLFSADYPGFPISGRSYAEVDRMLQDDPDLRRRELRAVHHIYGHRMPSLDEPVLVIEHNQRRRVVDGNGRMLARMLGMGSFTRCYIGRRPSDATLCGHWEPTSLVLELITFAEQYGNSAPLLHLVSRSECALYSFLCFTNPDSPLRREIVDALPI